MAPVPVLSNSWKATMKRVSGAHNTDSNARNSWNEISLRLWMYKKRNDILLNTKTYKAKIRSYSLALKDQFIEITHTHKTFSLFVGTV